MSERSGRDGRRVSSTSYYKEPYYHKRTHQRYETASSTTGRYNDDKKFHSHPNSNSLPASSSSHRYYSLPDRANEFHHHRYQHGDQHGSKGASTPRVPTYRRSDPKQHYSSRARRVPPPLSPPPLMKIPAPASSSSRYRQAPPEDHSVSRHKEYSTSREPRKERNMSMNLKIPQDRPEEMDVKKIRKRKPDPDQYESNSEPKKNKETTNETSEGKDGDVVKDIGGTAENAELKDNKTAGSEMDEQTEINKTSSCAANPSSSSKALLRLYCPYCDERAVTLKEFVYHTKSYQHTSQMSKNVGNMKKKLGSLRETQREEQKKLEKSEDGKKDLSDTSSYCRVCELNFRTDPKQHEKQELHNKLKSLVDRTCDICDIQFRFWKVYMYHVVALEHVKRVALLEASEKEAKGECAVQGTNLSAEELGLDLMELQTVVYCKACVRYLPIRENMEETKERHCMTLSHIKQVDDYNLRHKSKGKKQKSDDTEVDDTNIELRKAKGNETLGDSTNEESNFSGVQDTKSTIAKEEVDDEDEIQLHAEEDETVGVSVNG